jgi:stage III sporulation protein AA
MGLTCAWNELLRILPPNVRLEVDRLGKDTLQEIRLRQGKNIQLIRRKSNIELSQVTSEQDLQFVINAASRYSPWTSSTVKQGFLTAHGGHRIGICGEVIIRDGEVHGFSTIFSLNIRVARDIHGISSNLKLREENVLILGPPGSGKTTLLRDLIRRYSLDHNITVVDERGEIFPLTGCFDTGKNTDVLLGCSKKSGIEMGLRTMSPNYIAVDEITAESDCYALIRAAWCGVYLLVTAHATSVRDLENRSVYKPLVDSGLFNTAIILRPDKTWYTERMR